MSSTSPGRKSVSDACSAGALDVPAGRQFCPGLQFWVGIFRESEVGAAESESIRFVLLFCFGLPGTFSHEKLNLFFPWGHARDVHRLGRHSCQFVDTAAAIRFSL